jgi:hypothetical protein
MVISRPMMMKAKTALVRSELRDFCQDEAHFRPISGELKDSDRKKYILRRLIDYADRKGLVPQLLEWAKKTNPTRYAEGEPYEGYAK